MMELVTTFWIIVTALLWLVLVMLRAVEITPPLIGRFELKRRVEEGDPAARHDMERADMLGRLTTLKRLAEVSLLVLASVLTVFVFGWFLGLLLAVVLAFFLEALAARGPVKRLAESRLLRYERSLVVRVQRWPWLDLLTVAEPVPEARLHSRPELDNLLQRSVGVLSGDELTTIRSVLKLGDKTVADVMTPRSVIDTVAADDGVGPLVLDSLHKTGHSRFPVIEGDVDHVVGMLYLHDLVNLKSDHTSVRAAMKTPVHYIRQDQDLEHALHGFLRTHHHLFIVVNEYRETVGVLSLEDVMEAILGRSIVDEFDEFHDLRKVAQQNPRKNNQPKRFKNI